MIKALSYIKRRWLNLLADIDSDPHNLKKILPQFFLLFFLPLIFVVLPTIFFMFLVFLSAPMLFIILILSCLVVVCVLFVLGLISESKWVSYWRAARLTSFMLACLGVSTFLFCASCVIVSKLGFSVFSREMQFPIVDLQTINIDSGGRIYFLDGLYCRLQIFDKDVGFIKGWFVPNSTGRVSIVIDERNNTEVLNTTLGRRCTYNVDGRLVSSQDIYNSDYDTGKYIFNTDTVEDRFGNSYIYVDSFLSPWKLLELNGEQETVLLSEPYLVWFMSPPLPAFFFVLAGLIFSSMLRCYPTQSEAFTTSRADKQELQ